MTRTTTDAADRSGERRDPGAHRPDPEAPRSDGGAHRPDAALPADAAADGPRARRDRGTGLLLLAGGLVGALAAVVLLVEKLDLLENPGYVPSCSIDPVLSCGTIMRTAQASAFGFPNPVIGIASFPVLAAVGALLLSRVTLPRWTWLSLQFGATIGLGLVLWLMAESLLVIHALCPYCMVVWVIVLAVWWYVTVHNMAAGHLGGGPVAAALVRRHGLVLAAMYLVAVVAVVSAFPDYFASYVGL